MVVVFKSPCLLEIHNEIQMKDKFNTCIKLSERVLCKHFHIIEWVSPENLDTKLELSHSKHGIYMESPDLP